MPRPASDRSDLTVFMTGYQAGNAAAFERLYEALMPILGRYLRSLTHDAAWSDDLVQETFLQIHRARHTYDPAYPVQPWALGIAKHVFLMQRRTRARKGDFDPLPPIERDAAGGQDQEQRLLAHDRVRRGLASLTPGTRRAVLLHHVWGWSFDQVAERLGVGKAAAKLRASRGMAALRKSLDEDRARRR